MALKLSAEEGSNARSNRTSPNSKTHSETYSTRASYYPVGNFLSKRLHLPEPWLAPGISVILSLGASVIGVALTFLVIKLRAKSRK